MRSIGLYVHWPYCTRLCPYCDFNIYKNRPDTEEDLIAALLTDMRYWRGMSGARNLTSIHFGGGTPSLMRPENLGRIIDLAKTLWTSADNLGIGLEANPNNITEQALGGWRRAGIERLSVGVQSFDADVLKFLGRDHDGMQAKAGLEMAVKVMPRVSADLIYGWTLPEKKQTLEDWNSDLQTALQTGVTHISAYQLTIESGTAFGLSERRGIKKAVDGDTSADLYELGLEILGGAGFTQYEVSNFAKSKPAQSRHNRLYWEGGDYVGVGPGAHGRVTSHKRLYEDVAHGRVTCDSRRNATICVRKPQAYIEHVEQYGHGMSENAPLSAEAWGQEYLLMGLRITEGISLSRYAEIAGTSLSVERIAEYVQMGLLSQNGDSLATTPAGRLVLDHISHELLLD